MAQTSRTVNLARSTVNCRCHVCAFFNSRDDEYKVMLPFFKDSSSAAVKAIDKAHDQFRWFAGGWAVKEEGAASPFAVFKTQGDAWEKAKSIARKERTEALRINEIINETGDDRNNISITDKVVLVVEDDLRFANCWSDAKSPRMSASFLARDQPAMSSLS